MVKTVLAKFLTKHQQQPRESKSMNIHAKQDGVLFAVFIFSISFVVDVLETLEREENNQNAIFVLGKTIQFRMCNALIQSWKSQLRIGERTERMEKK